jgi:5-methylcytosine-specific restriction endonuclease McrA
MKTHHVQVHGESIAGELVDCDWCGEEMRVTYQRAEQDHQFCGDTCMGKWESKHESGENHYNYKGKVEVSCEVCGQTKKVFPSRVKPDKVYFCSGECKGEYYSEKYSGENSWHWKGGAFYNYGNNWDTQRLKAIIRDQARCQGCGMTEPEHIGKYDRELNVHHIIPRRQYKTDNGGVNTEKANHLENLATLCNPCHKRWEAMSPLRPE